MVTQTEEIKKAIQTEEPFMSAVQNLKTETWGISWDTRPFEKMRKHVSEHLDVKYTSNGTYLYDLHLHFKELDKLNKFVATL
jgi:hypothetical protein